MYSFISCLTIPRYFLFAKVLLISWALMFPALSMSSEVSQCGRLLRNATRGTFESVMRSESCPLTFRLIDWLQLQKPGIPFLKTIAFLRKNPDWPLKDRIQTLAENGLKGNESAAESMKWFEKNPPLTLKGSIFYARILLQKLQKNSARRVLENAWIRMDFEKGTLKPFWVEFKNYLTLEDHQKRVDRLLNEEKIIPARALLPWLDEPYKVLVEARIALIQLAEDAKEKLAKVSDDLSQNSGLLYDHVKWCRRKEQNEQMLKLLKQTSHSAENEELFWKERNLLVRRMMDEHRYQDAYTLAKNHGLLKGESFANAEWLAGWIALRMLKKPGVALAHFENLYTKVKSPISLARASYWAGRAAAVLKKQDEAKRWMTKAKTYPGTYYGQVALRGGVVGKIPFLHSPRPKVDIALRQKFEQKELVRVIRLLSAMKSTHLIDAFGAKLFQELKNPGEQILLIELLAKEGTPYHGVLAAKKLPMKNVPLIDAAFPVLPSSYHKALNQTDRALVHAIIRQESRFNPTALSPAGAQGLMQLMPQTAAQTARKKGIVLKSLSNPQVNVPLGCAYLKTLLDRYNGSFILAIAAYNAGPTAVDEWIVKYEDPRNQGVDLVDWIEKIPFAETRNYVQRVLENHAYYAQKLGRKPNMFK